MNATLDCSTFHLLHYSFLQEFSKDLFILMCYTDAIIFFSATLGNTLILIALIKSQSIHSPSKALLSSLAFSGSWCRNNSSPTTLRPYSGCDPRRPTTVLCTVSAHHYGWFHNGLRFNFNISCNRPGQISRISPQN